MQDNGIILVNKPKGFTSHDVVAITRRFLRQRDVASALGVEAYSSSVRKRVKVGHAGTLDPQAEGVLPICVGRATKFVDFLGNSQKQYKATLTLGLTTDTQDIWGVVTDRREVAVSREDIETVIHSFIGNIKQIPPMYSAIKQNGKKLYELARKGIEVERAPRDVTIHNIEILSISGDELASSMESEDDMKSACDEESENGMKSISGVEVEMLVDCSKGTYIRTLCHDIGEKLGCGGVMSGLVRTKVGDFSLDDCCDLESLQFIKTSVVIGTFDGVHMAHRELVRRACNGGMKTFALVIEPDDGSGSVLTTSHEKAEKLQCAGAGTVILVPLSKVRDLSCEEFFQEYLVNRLNATRVSVGFNFRFGRKREGDVDLLGRLCADNGIELLILSPQMVDNEIVSSTLIRKKAEKGEDIAGYI